MLWLAKFMETKNRELNIFKKKRNELGNHLIKGQTQN